MDYDLGVSKVSKYFKFKRQRYRTWLTALELWKHFTNGNTLISIINYLSISIYSQFYLIISPQHYITILILYLLSIPYVKCLIMTLCQTMV